MKITDALLAEHVVFHTLFDQLDQMTESVKTVAEAKALGTLLEAMLANHSKVEDELLIEPLEHCMDHLGQHENFHEEHEEIDAHLAALKTCRTLKMCRRYLSMAVAVSRKHFDKEERIVFPLAEQYLKGKTLTELGARWQQQRKIEMGILR